MTRNFNWPCMDWPVFPMGSGLIFIRLCTAKSTTNIVLSFFLFFFPIWKYILSTCYILWKLKFANYWRGNFKIISCDIQQKMGLDDMIVFTEVCNKSFSIYNCFDIEFKLNNNDYFYDALCFFARISLSFTPLSIYRKHSCFEWYWIIFFFFNTKYENQISDFSFQQVKKGNSKPGFF